MKTLIALAMCIGWLAAAPHARADQTPPPSISPDGIALVLNGYGEREQWWTDVYRCALYLSARTDRPEDIRKSSTAKAIRIRVLYGDIPDRMPESWRETFSEELNRELMGRLKRAFRRIEENDVLVFSYRPGGDTKVRVNGEILLTDPGYELMAGLVDQWLGDRPVSKNLKRLLLSRRD